MTRAEPELVVIGAGMAGISLATRAAPRFRVTVLEAEAQPGYHSTGRSAAVAIECYENDVVRELTLAGMDEHRGHGARPIGCVTIADETHLEELAAFEDYWASGAALPTAPTASSVASAPAPPLVEIPVPELLQRVPVLRPDCVARALIEPGALALDAHGLLESFRKRLRAEGGRIVANARVDRLERRAGRWEVGCGDRSFAADLVVNAAGAWGDEVARLAMARPLGLQPRRRTALLIEPGVDASAWPLVHRVQGGLYFKPEAGLLMVSPADAHPSPPCDAQPEEIDLALAAHELESMTTLRVDRMRQSWAGLRTFTPDELPAVGFDPEVDDFFWLVGQGGFGIQTAPGLSALAAELLVGGAPPLTGSLNPARFE